MTFFFIYTFLNTFLKYDSFFFIYDLYITYSPFIFVIRIICLLWISITNVTKQRSTRHYRSLPPEFLLLSRQTEVMLDGFLLGLVWLESNTYRVRIIFSVHVVSLHKQIHLNKQLQIYLLISDIAKRWYWPDFSHVGQYALSLLSHKSIS